MKNYSLNYNEYKMFILNYEIKDDRIIINYADGEKSLIPYTFQNEKKRLLYSNRTFFLSCFPVNNINLYIFVFLGLFFFLDFYLFFFDSHLCLLFSNIF